MIRKLLIATLTVTMLTLSTLAFADVFVTENGKKYHKEECPLIKNKNPHSIEKSEAIKQGLEPCARCFKDELSKSDSDSTKQVASKKKSKNKKQD